MSQITDAATREARRTPTSHSDPARTGVGLPSRAAVRTGFVLGSIAAAFLAFDAGMKLLQLAPAVTATTQLGYPASVVLPLGVVQLACLVIYLVPRTAVLGAVLWTGYLGGAIATHVRVESPLATHTLFPLYIALLLWGGLWLREPRVRALLPAVGDQKVSR